MKTAPQFFRHGPGPFARLFVFILLSCLLIAEDLRFKYFPELRQGIGVVIFPLQKIAYLPTNIYDQIEELFASFHLLEENIKLRQQYLTDREQLLTMHTLQTENMHLRQLLGAVQHIETNTDAKAVLADILYTPRDPFNHKITLNKGHYHGIQLGQPVIDDKGIIGQITQLYPWSAEVTLLIDKNHSVPVQVLRNSLRSVVTGTGKKDELELRYLSVSTDIQQGDLLVTSGIGGVYPTGIPVAMVQRIERDPVDDFVQIISKPIAGVDRNRQVLVLSLVQPSPTDSTENPEIESQKTETKKLDPGEYFKQDIYIPPSGQYIAISLIIALTLNFLPFPQHVLLYRPDFVALTLMYWSVNHPHKIGMSVAFMMGLLMDVGNTSILGQHALAYCIVIYLTLVLGRRLRIFNLFQQAPQIGLILLVMQIVIVLIGVLGGSRLPGWPYFFATAAGILLWVPISALLNAPLKQKSDPNAL